MDEARHQILRRIIRDFEKLSYISPDDVPDIPLYMDQITSFMESRLGSCKRNPDDKILTKTMINNYTKNRLIPPPDKKKYSMDHLLLLIFVYYLKDFLQINDIKTLLGPLVEITSKGGEGKTMFDIYDEVFHLVQNQKGYMVKDLIRRWKHATEAFPDLKSDDPDAKVLSIFAFICLLSFDVYVKKNLIEALIDTLT